MTSPQEGIPSEFSPESSMTLLGWDVLRRALAGHALSAVARDRCLSWAPVSTPLAAQQLLDETSAMLLLLDTAEGFPIRSFADIQQALNHAARDRMIEPEEGLAVLDLLTLVGAIRRRLNAQTAPDALRVFAPRLSPMLPLLKELDRCLDPETGVSDNASPELKAAVREAAQARQQLDHAVKKIMGSAGWKDTLQDAYITEREGRAVLPVRADSRGRVDGIVHDSSGSGQTLFVEPTSVIPLNNQLKIARLNVDRERARVLAHLAEQILQEKPGLLDNLQNLTTLDAIHARARLARAMRARSFELTETGEVDLRQARNPELVLSGKHVVPNTLAWKADTRVLIISGPNTGGKTVTLKTLGLMSLMARSGLLLPVEENSRIPFYPQVFADIGDEQDLGQDLSTFSGHLKKIIHILQSAQPGALILLDELGIATDPQQGAALAQAILMQMKERNLMTLVSTHYLSLKAFAQTAPGFLNACTEFDMDTISPTFRLVFGAPGQSAALETAERLGLDAGVIRHARELYDRGDHRAEVLLEELTRQKQGFERERAELAEHRRQAHQDMLEQNTIRARLREQELEFRRNKNQKLQIQLREAKNEIRKLMEEARRSKNITQLRKMEQHLTAMGRQAASVPSAKRAFYTRTTDQLRKGDEVMIEGYDAIGVLEEDPAGKSSVRVKLGNFSTLLECKRLLGHAQGHRTQPRDRDKPGVTIQTESHSTPRTTCDLRGKTIEEARHAMELFLSQAVLNKCPRVILIHGHGMGRIKQMVRDYLGSTGIGKGFAPAGREEGGDGATVVEL